MIHVRWLGVAPEGAWLERLAKLGISSSSPKSGQEPTLTVLRTAGREQLKIVDRAAWFWIPGARPSLDAERRAVLAGALDVAGADDPQLLSKLVASARQAQASEAEPPDTAGFVANSKQARRVLAEVRKAAATSMPVLITGETGTGKELTARLVHDWSKRREKLFVPVFCAAIPNELIEAELFGYVRGAFSGAVRDYAGLLAAAEGGTVFLDEVDDTPPTLQTKLLRVLEDRVVSQLGRNEWRRVDFRIVAATNRDLQELIERGVFGQDLYERLAILHVRLPPLRERSEDLAALTRHFIERFYVEEPPAPGRARVLGVSERALEALSEYHWPGNVRELRNSVYESLVRKSEGEELRLSDLPRRVLSRDVTSSRDDVLVDGARLSARFEARRMNLRQELVNLERAALIEALRRTGGNPTAAARLLGEVGRGTARDPAGTVRAMMRRLGIAPSEQP